LTTREVCEALRVGRVYVAVELWRDATGFRFEAHDGDTIAVLGEEVVWSKALELVVSTPAAARIRLLRDGVDVASVEGTSLRHAPAGVGVYRVEAELDGRLWIASNPIWVR
jgi:hypothetical protein